MASSVGQFRWPVPLAAIICAAILGVNYVAGAFTAVELPPGYSSLLQLIGQVLMFALLTPYLILASVYGRRYSISLASSFGAKFQEEIARIPLPILCLGAVAGALNGFFNNLSPSQIEGLRMLEPIHTLVSLSNILTWATVGVTLTLRLLISIRFYRQGQQVEIDLFNVSRLKPFSRNALADVLMICGAIALTVFQALDATFRADNFINALVVAMPAVIILFLLPSYGIHKRISAMKQTQLDSIQALIDNSPRALQTSDMNDLEVLLQRRERILSAPSWPIDLSMLYRLLLYFVIPPLAWVAAAMVEIYLESTIGG